MAPHSTFQLLPGTGATQVPFTRLCQSSLHVYYKRGRLTQTRLGMSVVFDGVVNCWSVASL